MSKKFITQKYLIYALSDPRTNEIRYVGKSSSGMIRPRMHFRTKSHLNGKTWCDRWCRSLVDNELEPAIDILEEFSSQEELCSTEEFWIGYLRMIGCRLTNLTDGGEGTPGRKLSAESRQKIGSKNKISLKGRKPWNTNMKKENCEGLRKLSESMKGNKNGVGNSGPHGRIIPLEEKIRRANSNRHPRGPYKKRSDLNVS